MLFRRFQLCAATAAIPAIVCGNRDMIRRQMVPVSMEFKRPRMKCRYLFAFGQHVEPLDSCD